MLENKVGCGWTWIKVELALLSKHLEKVFKLDSKKRTGQKHAKRQRELKAKSSVRRGRLVPVGQYLFRFVLE